MTQIVVRTDEATSRALRHLVELTGRGRSELVREAIQAAERAAVLERVQAEADALRDDPVDRAESLALAEEMETLRAW